MKALTTVALACILGFFLGGCATTATGSLHSKSARLETQSRELYSELREQSNEPASDEASRAAEALILSSRDLNRAVERRATTDQVLGEFDRVSRDFKHLEECVATNSAAEKGRVKAVFDHVTEAYKQVANSMPEQKQAATQRVSINTSTSASASELDRRARLKDYWFP